MPRRNFDIDHIEPRWEEGRDYQLVCGFETCPLNLREETQSENARKNNKFLPWRWIRDEAGVVPCERGDLAFFLVGADIETDTPGEWVLMEFLSEEWFLAAKYTGYTGTAKNLERCREMNETFGGWRRVHEVHPNLFSDTLKETHRKYPNLRWDSTRRLLEWAKNNPEEAHEAKSRGAHTLNKFYRENYEAAVERGKPGIEKMNEYWESHERSACLRMPVQVTLPDGSCLTFRSKIEAFTTLGIPKSTFYKIERNELHENSPWFGYSVSRLETLETNPTDHQLK